jgi:glycosyltransferase involved in cell wall biosynthesis
MRVIHVITRLIVGGAQENTLTSVHGLQHRHHIDVRLLSGPTTGPEGSLQPDPSSAHIPFEIVPTLVRPVHPWLDLLAYRDLSRRFRIASPHIVHTHSGKAGFLGRLAAHRARVPIIVHTIHGPSFGPWQGKLANAMFLAAERLAARVTTHFVAVAQAMVRQYLRAGIGRPDQYSVLYSGFDLHPFLDARPDPALRAHLNLDPAHFVVGKIARLFALKGHDDLIAIAPAIVAQCPNARFLLVGDGSWRARLQSAIQDRGLSPYFVFAGLVPPTDVPRHLALMDVLVHLSRREGLPRALPQAMAAARPVVALNLDGAPEVCLDNQTGFLVPPDDLDTLTRRLLELARNPDLRLRLAQQGRTLAQTRFSDQSMVDGLHQLYRRLLANNPVAQPHPSAPAP